MSASKTPNPITIGILLILLPIMGGAEEISNMDVLLEMTIEQLLNVPISKITSASKYEQKSTEAPASVSVVTAEDIKRYGYRTLAELLSGLEGLYFITDNHYVYPGIRGMSRPGDYGSRIAALIDGHRVNDDIYGSIEIGTGFPLDLEAIEKVEIVRGPVSSLYGQGAFFGVINVVTRHPKDHQKTELSIAAQDKPTHYYSNLTAGHTFDNGTHLLISAGASDRPGEDFYTPEYNNPPFTDGLAHQRDYQQTQRAFAKLNHNQLNLNALYSRRELGQPVYYGVILDSSSRIQETRGYLDTSYSQKITDSLDTELRLSWNLFGYEMKNYFDYGLAQPVVNNIEFTSQWLNAIWQWQWHHDKHHWIGGLEYQHSLTQDMLSYNEEPYSQVAHSQTHDGYWAIFIQDEYKFTNKWVLNTGLRYDSYDAFAGEISPRAALLYQQTPQTTWKLLAGKAFRAPAVIEEYYDDGSYLRRNPNGLQPETLKSYEFILDHYFTEMMRGSLSLYTYELKNSLELEQEPIDQTWSYNNIGSAKVQGLEWVLKKNWQTGLETQINYTRQQAEDGNTGHWLSNSPKNMLKMRTSFPLTPTWRANAQLIYMGSMYLPHNQNSPHSEVEHPNIPSYTTLDLTLINTPWRNFEWGLYIYNLFDRDIEYPLSSSVERIKLGGRAIRIKLNCRY